MEDKQFAREPLLYIHQPTISKPSAPMQHHYHTPKQMPTNHDSGKSSRKKFRAEGFEEQSEKYFDEENSKKQNSKFKEMTILEKVKYLEKQPEHVPRIKCLLRTAEKTYEGIITSFEDHKVSIWVGRGRPTITVPIEKITSIHLLGF